MIVDYRKILKKQYKKGKFIIKQRPNCNDDFKKTYDVFYCGVHIAIFNTNSLIEGTIKGWRFHTTAVDKKSKPSVYINFKITHKGAMFESAEIINPELLAQFYFTKRVLVEKTRKPMEIRYITFSSPERLNEYMNNF